MTYVVQPRDAPRLIVHTLSMVVIVICDEERIDRARAVAACSPDDLRAAQVRIRTGTPARAAGLVEGVLLWADPSQALAAPAVDRERASGGIRHRRPAADHMAMGGHGAGAVSARQAGDLPWVVASRILVEGSALQGVPCLVSLEEEAGETLPVRRDTAAMGGTSRQDPDREG